MASIFRKSYYKVVNGKRVKRFARKYSIKYKDEFGQWRTQPGTTDKELTRRMAASIEHDVDCRRRGKVDPYEAPKKEPLSEHAQAYRRFLEAKQRGQDHIDRTLARIDAVFGGCGFTRIEHLLAYNATDRVGAFLQKLETSNKTRNYYLTAVGAFCRWAARQGRMAPSPIALMEKLNTETDDPRERRVITAKQFAALIRAADRGEPTHNLTGPDRAMLYMVAAYTGLRAAELASLTPAAFKPGGIAVRASITKNKENVLQPISPDLAKLVQKWLQDRPVDQLLWSGKWYRRAAEMLRVDLGPAKIEYETPEGVFDFHSLRATYVTNLCRSGVHPKIVQTLARHSTIVLTMGLYAKLDASESAAALAKLPPLPRRKGA